MPVRLALYALHYGNVLEFIRKYKMTLAIIQHQVLLFWLCMRQVLVWEYWMRKTIPVLFSGMGSYLEHFSVVYIWINWTVRYPKNTIYEMVCPQ